MTNGGVNVDRLDRIAAPEMDRIEALAETDEVLEVAPGARPPPTRAVRFAGSTSMRVRPDRSTTIASSAVPNPGTLCPPPRIATARPVATACDTTACTSSALVQPTMALGLASIMKLYTWRASSYSASSGPMTGPVTSFRSAVVDMEVPPLSCFP